MAAEVREPRVYTDERLPSLKIVNQGDTRFMVYEDGVELHTFVAYEQPGVNETSEQFAQGRAKAYFDFMSQTYAPMEPGEDIPIEHKQPPSRLDWKPSERGVNPLAGMREMTSQDVEAIIAAARAEPDEEKAAALRQQALSMMQQQESVAQRVARLLLTEL